MKKNIGVFVVPSLVAFAVACGGGGQTQQPAQTAGATPTATPTAAPADTGTATTAPTGSGSTTPAASPQQTLDIAITGLRDAWNSHDPSKIAALYTDGAVFRVPGMPDANRDAIKADAANQFAGFPDFKVTITRTVESPSTGVAAVEWVVTATNTGDMKTPDGKTMPKTGRQVGVHGIDIVWIDAHGLIKEDHRYFDVGTEMMQLDPHAHPGSFRAVEAAPTTPMETHDSTGSAAEQQNLAASAAAYRAMNDHNLDGWLATMADDATWTDWTMPNGDMHGKADAKKWFAMMATAFPDMHGTASTQLAADDYVVVESTVTGTNKGPMPPILPHATNKTVTGHGVDVIQLKDGKAIHGWSYGNGMEFATQLGLMPPPGGGH
jgi:steroid delta-isomerase-like uncharacterized protein/uncharacterized protein (TIGR02246 family)